MKLKAIVLFVGATCATITASAGVVGWWRFNGEGTNVPNVAAPGTLDGTIVSVNNNNNTNIADFSEVSFGSDPSKYPAVTSNLQADAPRVYDPLDGSVQSGGKTLSYKQKFVQGGVMVPYSETLANLTTFTVEAIIRLPTDAGSRTEAYGASMLPIVQFGRDQTEGWMFSVYQGYLFCRFTYKNTSGNNYGQQQITENYYKNSGFPSLYDGKWHHVAMVFTTAGSHAVCRMFVDGVQYAENRTTVWKSWYYTRNLPLFIGANPWTRGRTFYGDIAEVRITDNATSKDQNNNFLVPLLDGQGLSDDDTALLLKFDNTAKFGFSSNAVIATKKDTSTSETAATDAYIWYAKNWNILNAAYANPLVPEWSPYAEKGNEGYNKTDALRPQVADAVRGELLRYSDGAATNVALDASSLRFTPVQTNKTYNYVTDAINLKNAYTLTQGSFTVEFVFKTDTFPTSDTVTLFHSPYLLLCIFEGKAYARGYTSSYGSAQNLSHTTGPLVNDGAWHHAAVTWDGSKLSLYVDGSKISDKTFAMYSSATASDTCYIGTKYKKWNGDSSLSNSSQGFKGVIDAVRITRRVLATDEFLKSEALPERLLDARFDNDTAASFATGLPDYLAAAGTGETMSGGTAAPAIVGSRGGKVVFSSTEKSRFGKALKLDGGYVIYPRNRLLERRSFTLEFFGKFPAQVNSVTFARLNVGASLGDPVWALYNGISSDKNSRLTVAATLSTDGGVTGARQDKALYNFTTHAGEWEGWHHWALTVAESGNRTAFTLYKDGSRVVSETLNGILYIPPEGTCFTFGASIANGAYMDGKFDNIRISDGVLDPSEFMGYEPDGTAVILR